MKKTLLSTLIVAGSLVCWSSVADARPRGGGGAHTPRTGGQRTFEGTHTGPNGQTRNVERNTNINKTGANSWHRDSQQTVTGPNGKTRGWEASGDGTRTKTETGVQKTYQGTVTNDKGKTTTVNRETNVTKNADGSVTRDTDATYTKENGNTVNVDRSSTTTKNADGTITTNRESSATNGEGRGLGTGQSTTVRTPGVGSETTGSYTNGQGKTWQYQGEATRTEPGQATWERSVTNPQGGVRSTTANAKWQLVDGKWVRMQETQSTVTPAPTP